MLKPSITTRFNLFWLYVMDSRSAFPADTTQSHPGLFPPTSPNFLLPAYHIQGSRILSRSFTIPSQRAGRDHGSAHTESTESDEDDEEDDVAVMIPLADMLNAAYGRDNAKLYGNDNEENDRRAENVQRGAGYTMITSKSIKAGEQIVYRY